MIAALDASVVLSHATIHADDDVFPDGRGVIGQQSTDADHCVVVIHNRAAELRACVSGVPR